MEALKATYQFRGAEYLVCSDGTIYGPKGNPLKWRSNHDGYAVVTMGKKGHRATQFVHRIVAQLFLPNPNGLPEVDHLDNNRFNPSLDNLEWVTRQQNTGRASSRGSHKDAHKGEHNGRAKLTPDLVLQMRSEYQAGTRIIDLQKKYEHPFNTISNAVRGLTWQHLPMPEDS